MTVKYRCRGEAKQGLPAYYDRKRVRTPGHQSSHKGHAISQDGKIIRKSRPVSEVDRKKRVAAEP